MISRLLGLTLGVSFVFYSIHPLNAQNIVNFSGRVIDSETSIGLANANVYFPELGLGTATNNAGNFRMTGLPRGSHLFDVTSIGYGKKVDSVDLAEKYTEIHIKLKMVPYLLDGVEVRGLMTSRLSTEKVEVITADQKP